MKECTKESDKNCLPDIIECENFAEWNSYLDKLYRDVFSRDFLESRPIFKGWRVLTRKEPMDGNWEHSFTHMTHEDLKHTLDPNDRIPDPRRSERLVWVRRVIENYQCSLEKECGEILYWEEMYRGRIRSYLLVKEERFLVVLEKARNVYFIITSFYLESDFALEKRMEKYNRYQKQKTPLE